MAAADLREFVVGLSAEMPFDTPGQLNSGTGAGSLGQYDAAERFGERLGLILALKVDAQQLVRLVEPIPEGCRLRILCLGPFAHPS